MGVKNASHATADRRPDPARVCRVALGIGSNLGDRERHLRCALALLRAGGLRRVRLSPLFESDPLDCDPGTPPFLNAAVVGFWGASPEALLDLAQACERRLGRPRCHSSRTARTLDIDVLLIADLVLATSRLQVPHPRLRLRRFALAPLAALAPAWVLPPDGPTVADALRRLEHSGTGGIVRPFPPPDPNGPGPARTRGHGADR
jgi:2-amino-4-hydroxy-6-hydroxymethyldihydropteridine diphosphokinase